ncbi:type II toxin-antitoxin system Phd/YefM family antitoxin [Devosia geojensis]|uniref:type II toxin-antitoxin system Phd/YefM family antitoxin n=1 Tax=Devosia geojensis TaxID=443610 RepID=UPI0009FC9E0B|nr:type II toxin-antitoxin system prevent-host-death family antitoxin [Devosia geojensis]
MKHVNLADAKARLSELVTNASQGETVEITRRGRVVARLVPPEAPGKRPVNVEALRRHLESLSGRGKGAGEFVRQMRDEDRY